MSKEREVSKGQSRQTEHVISVRQVIAVEPLSSASAPLIAHTEYGEVHQIAGSRPTPQQITQDKQVVQKINHTVGKSYVQAQRGLPDTIVVTGGSGSGSNSSAAEKLGEH